MPANSSALKLKLKLSCLGLLLVLTAAPGSVKAGVTCSAVYGSLTPCLGYISGGPLSSGCCPGIRTVVGSASTKADRQSLCSCLKSLLASYSSRIGKANFLLKICGVRLPVPLSLGCLLQGELRREEAEVIL